jgi:DNA-binding beta-propeller fold protein YncE
MPSGPARRCGRTCLGVVACCVAASLIAQAQSLGSPARIAVGPQGDVAVTDHRRATVLILDAGSLGVKHTLGISGKPLGIAWGAGRLFVGNDSTGAIEVFTQRRNRSRLRLHGPERRYVRVPRVHDHGSVPQPTDMAVDESTRRLFVVSGGEKAVKIFDFKGRLLYTLAGPGSGPGDLSNPTGIAVDATVQEVFVSDYGDPVAGVSASVQIYDYDGNYLAGISGDSGQSGFEFSRPQGLAVDGSGHVFLVDSLLGQVLIFDRESLQGLGTVGSYGSEAGQLLLPLDVVIDPATQDLLVTNNRHGRIEVFVEGGVVP